MQRWEYSKKISENNTNESSLTLVLTELTQMVAEERAQMFELSELSHSNLYTFYIPETSQWNFLIQLAKAN